MIDRCPFGIGALDLATNGGWLVGRVNLLTGRPKTGKTTVAGYALVSFLQQDASRRVWLYDGEYKISLDWFVELGADARRLEIRPPMRLEDLCNEVLYQVLAVESTEVGFILVDGIRLIPSEVREGVGERSSVAYGPISPEAHVLNRFWAKVALYQAKRAYARQPPVTIFLTNHETRGMPVGNFPAPIVIPGGTVQLFAAALRIRFERPLYLGVKAVGEMEVATRVEFNFTVEANVDARSQNAGVFRMYQTEQAGRMDEFDQYITWGEETDYLRFEKKKTGERFYLAGKEMEGGRPQLVLYWREHEEEYQRDKQEILRQMSGYLAALKKPEKKEKR